MIVVNYFQDEDYNPDTDGYYLHLAGVINDELELQDDVNLIKEAIENSSDFNPKNGVVYEIYLDRARTRAPYPVIDPSFCINRVVEKKYSADLGFYTPIVEL